MQLLLLKDCDAFTKNFLKKLGVKVGDSVLSPNDPYTDHRRKVRIFVHKYLPIFTMTNYFILHR